MAATRSAVDDAAFAALHAAHARHVKAFFLRCGFGAADADDLTQETFVLAFRGLSMFDPARGEFRPWVGAIARNLGAEPAPYLKGVPVNG